HGEVLVGRDRIAVDGTGWRSHFWGPSPLAEPAWWWLAGRFDDGGAVSASWPGEGWQQGPDGERLAAEAALVMDDAGAGLSPGGVLTLGSTTVVVTAMAHAPVRLDPAAALV